MKDHTEIVMRQFAAWNDGNFDDWTEAWHPDVVVVAPEGWPEGEVNHGLEEWKRQAQRLRNSWAEARIDVDDIRDGENCVVARIRYVTTGEGTQLPFETPMAGAFFFREGRIALAQYFWEFGDALETAGLAE